MLGEHQDAVVAQTWLRDHAAKVAAEPGDPNFAVIFAAGAIAGRLHADAQTARDTLPEVWKRASRPRLRAFL